MSDPASAERTANLVLLVGLVLGVLGLVTALLSLTEVQSPGGVMTSLSTGFAGVGLAVAVVGIVLRSRARH